MTSDFSSRAEAIRSRLADACASESMLIFSDSANAIIAGYYREDLPDALAEIERLHGLIERMTRDYDSIATKLDEAEKANARSQ